jgi:hypothetical protein
MGRRLTKVEREAGINYAGPPYRNPGPTASQVVYGSDRPGSWQMPGPHARQQVIIGGDVHRDLIVKSDNRSTAEVIADLVARSK